ncbi:MFS general substrate transporter [Amylocystis lapponica]|nr:MFS general substrate transporter [Amylocystis lapponica]
MSPGASSRFRLVLVCIALAANGLSGAGLYTLPLIAPAMVESLKLTQSQISMLTSGAIMIMHTSAIVVGHLLDRFGPWPCSLGASVFLAAGYAMVAGEFSHPSNTSEASYLVFERLFVAFGSIGLGSTFAYFSLVFGAIKMFPQYTGVATGTTLALLGISPVVLSAIATQFFTDRTAGLDVNHFWTFLAVFTGIVHVYGAFVLPGAIGEVKPISLPDEEIRDHDEPISVEVNESSPLLAVTGHSGAQLVPADEPDNHSVVGLLKDPYYWLFITAVAMVSGTGDMVKLNLGLIMLSLPSSPGSNNISAQVQLTAAVNTVARLCSGSLADYFSPVACYSPAGVWSFPRKSYFSRALWPVGASLVLCASLLWLVVGIRTQEAIWPFSIGIGLFYGCETTIIPSMVGAAWGVRHQARNYGILAYTISFAFPLLSYFYAAVADSRTLPDEDICHGAKCWKLTFGLIAGGVFASTLLSLVLWRRWRGKM